MTMLASEDDRMLLSMQPKYRLCTSTSGASVMFFCDWDWLFPPGSTFLGKPQWFDARFWRVKNSGSKPVIVHGIEMIDLLKHISPLSYTQDRGVKLICRLVAPDIVLRDRFPAWNLCEVPAFSVVETFYSTHLALRSRRRSDICNSRLQALEEVLPDCIKVGLLGSAAFTPENTSDADLDVVLVGPTVEQLTSIVTDLASRSSPPLDQYQRTLWPLSFRSPPTGAVDIFCSPLALPEWIPVTKPRRHIELSDVTFSAHIEDDKYGILGAPIWQIAPRKILLSTDNALRGRFRTDDVVVGHGIAVRGLRRQTLFVVDSTLIGRER